MNFQGDTNIQQSVSGFMEQWQNQRGTTLGQSGLWVLLIRLEIWKNNYLGR